MLLLLPYESVNSICNQNPLYDIWFKELEVNRSQNVELSIDVVRDAALPVSRNIMEDSTISFPMPTVRKSSLGCRLICTNVSKKWLGDCVVVISQKQSTLRG